jgi:hypothetical protein
MVITNPFKTDIDRLHNVAMNLENLPRGAGKTFYNCHSVASIISLAIENKEKDVLIVIFLKRYQANHIVYFLSNILLEMLGIVINFSKTNPYGLTSINENIKIKFANGPEDVTGYDDYYLVDMIDHE